MNGASSYAWRIIFGAMNYLWRISVYSMLIEEKGMQKLEGGISGHKNKKLRVEEVNVNSSDQLELFVIIAWIF